MYPSAPSHQMVFALLLGALSLAGCGNDPAGGGNDTQKVQCTLNSDCPATQVCGSDGFCSATFTGGDVAVDDQPDSQGDAAAPDAGAADAGGVPGKKGFCDECATHADCGTGWRCEVLLNKGLGGSDHFCVPVCTTDAGCQEGVKCTLVDDASKTMACIPPNYKCDGCSLQPCAKGQTCAYLNDPPVCVKAAATCSSCEKTEDCAATDFCIDVDGNGKVCVPRCDGGQDCGPAAGCQPFPGGLEACAWQADTCCYGPACQATTACKGCPDTCLAGQCVECTKDSHCKDGGKCNLTAKPPTCVKSACPDGKQLDADGACVDCLNATHCQANEICVSGKCETQTQDNVCKLCQDPYPACATISGQPACVECATDDDCKKKDAGTCDAKTYTCSGTTQGGAPDKGTCKTAADCVTAAGPATKFDLECDVASGLCYDKNGYCDNISAFCNTKAGSTCKEQGGLPGGGGSIPGLPAPPSGTQPGSGVCSCGAAAASGNPSSCNILPSCDCAKDPNGKDCNPLGIISCCALGCLEGLGGNSKPDPACFGGNTCLDMFCLFNALGGGGTGGGGGGGYCQAQNAP